TSEGARLALIGTAVGLGLSVAALRVLRSMLFGASPVDPLVMFVVSALLGLLVLVASYVPALRATRVDPVMALRYE
ncbi:MAG TPA: ABC transporter permease, partial [Gemmatimonadaceae bacterium]|nr:ABC transporter permease [Gemmatimonadaceae bacterium]